MKYFVYHFTLMKVVMTRGMRESHPPFQSCAGDCVRMSAAEHSGAVFGNASPIIIYTFGKRS